MVKRYFASLPLFLRKGEIYIMYYALLSIHFHDITNIRKSTDRIIETTVVAVSEDLKALQNTVSEWNSVKESVLKCCIDKEGKATKLQVIGLIEAFFNKYPAEKSDKIITKLCELLSMNKYRFQTSIEYANMTIHNVTLVKNEESKE